MRVPKTWSFPPQTKKWQQETPFLLPLVIRVHIHILHAELPVSTVG
jgi:hypothetical protein